MNTTKQTSITALLAGAAVLMLSACGGGQPAAAEAPGDGPVTSITITGNDQMRFGTTAFTVPAGAEITVVFENIGRMPKETMGHNLVIIDKGVDADTFAAASIRHPDTAYIAPQYADRVIAATDILGPGEKETLVFTAPSEPGAYPFVCSFPGHTPAGMKGIMTVE